MTLNRQELENIILNILNHRIFRYRKTLISLKDNLFEEGLDSLKLLTLIALIESELNVQIDNQFVSFNDFKSVDNIISTICQANKYN